MDWNYWKTLIFPCLKYTVYYIPIYYRLKYTPLTRIDDVKHRNECIYSHTVWRLKHSYGYFWAIRNFEYFLPKISLDMRYVLSSMHLEPMNFANFITYEMSKFFLPRWSDMKNQNIFSAHRSYTMSKYSCQQECTDLFWLASLPTVHNFSSIQTRASWHRSRLVSAASKETDK